MFSISAACRRSSSGEVRITAGTRSMPGLLRGAPAPLARDQLVAAVVERPDDQRLQQPDRADRPGQGVEGRGVELRARLVGVRLDLGDVELAQLRPAGVALRQDRRQAPPHAALALSHRPAPKGEHLVGQGAVGARARRLRIVLGDRDAVARRLGDPDAARHHRLEHPRGQVLAQLALDVLREAGAVVVHRDQDARHLEAGLSSRRTSFSVSRNWTRPSSARYSAWTGTITLSAATRALTATGPSDGGQSSSV